MTETRIESAAAGVLTNSAPLGKVGMVLLASDLRLEGEMPKMLPKGIGIYTNRVMNYNPLTIENLRLMRGDLHRAAAGIIPGAKMDAVVFGCTSGAAAIGNDEVKRLIRAAHAKAQVITPLTAAADACRAIGIRRLSILTPYIADVNRVMAEHFVAAGFVAVNIAGMNIKSDIDAAGVSADALMAAARACLDNSADALFISCTALGAAPLVGRMESIFGIPVLSSNQTLAWAVLRALGCDAAVEGFGRLLMRQWG